jgi:methionyl-tRNA formyltransferase
VIVVVAYGLILPQPVLDIAPQGALNIHASLLPRWRGAAPVQRAILAGDRETGVCIMQMDAGLDTGPVLKRRNIVISADDTSGSLLKKLTEVGAQLIVDFLDELRATSVGGAVTWIAQPQPAAGVTYAEKIEKRESRINWNEPAILIERKVRAFSPSPGTVTRLNGVEFKIWQAKLCDGTGLPGEVLAFADGVLRVACGQGALQLLELQRAGGRRLHAREFSLGIPVRAGDRCELPTIGS